MIVLQNIGKTFPTATGAVEALGGIDLAIPRGEIFGIIGSSGAGKSTLVRMINLLERPSSGTVLIDGEDVTAYQGARLRALRRRIGMVFQHFNLLSARTVAGNVAYPLELAGHEKAEISRRVDALLQRVGLSAHAGKYPRQLSGGQKQRVGIARALASDPDVLLCDEATSALDPQTTISILNLLRQINRELGVTVVIITHEMDVIRHACDRVAVLDHGKVAEIGSVADVFLSPSHAATHALLRESEPEQAEAVEPLTADAPKHRLRLSLLGDASRSPVLSEIARRHSIDFVILSGRVGHIGQTPYTQFTIAVDGLDLPRAVAYLQAAGARVDVLNKARAAQPQPDRRPARVGG